jgi:putative thiamine transport system ATP-binding protein
LIPTLDYLNIQVKTLKVDQKVLLQNLAIQVKQGQVFTIMGPSGCGKSLLLSVITGVVTPPIAFDGDIYVDGKNLDVVPTYRRAIGMLFQDDLLFGHLNVAENLLFSLPANSGTKMERLKLVEKKLSEVGLGGFGNHDPSHLSGGQRSRVSLLRTMLSQPRVLLLDEPFSQLDTHLRTQFRTMVFRYIKAANIAAILVTHDTNDIADTKAYINLQSFIPE